MSNIYTSEAWSLDGSFSADPGQEVSEEVYTSMLEVVPPLNLPRNKAKQALQDYSIPVHAGFLMGEPHSSNSDGQQLFHAFGMNDFGSRTKKGPRYFYLGLSIAEQPIADGFYYFFDCMNAMLTDRYFKESAFEGDKDAISTASNYEATLYKCEFKGGERVNRVTLYDPFGCFDDTE